MAEVAEEIVVSESGYRLPVEDLLTGRGAIFGKSGSGKSNTMTVVAEELLEQSLPLLIVDQDGEYHGLTEEYDVLHVGADSECDRTIGVDDGEHIADTALENNQPVILDVSGYMEEETARELVYTVVRRLFARENEVKKPFLLIVEEVHEYVPERGGAGELGDMLIRVAKRGRKRGLGICGVSQRPASVDKDFITQCDWIVWHRLTWRNDTKVVGRILGSDYADRVQELADGEAYVMADWDEEVRRVHFRLKRTLDAGATPGLEEFEDVGPDDSGSRAVATDGSSDDAAASGESADGDAKTSDTEIYAAGEDPSAVDAAPPGTAGMGPDRGGGPAGKDPDVANRGNPVWELGQMFVYLFGSVLFRTANLVRRIVPLVTPWQERPDPLGFPRSEAIDWKLTSLLMVVLNLLLLVVLGYLLMFELG